MSSSLRLPSAAAHAFVIDLERPTIDDLDRHHLGTVLRLRDGEEVTVSDGLGRWRLCAFRRSGDLETISAVQSASSPEPSITIAFALTKGDRPELVIQKLTELGVDRIVPIAAARSIVRWDDDRAHQNVMRWRAVSRSAAMQSRRVWLPIIDEVQPMAGLTGAVPGVVLAQRGGEPPSLLRPAIAVGPEGGWTDEECRAVSGAVDLGSTTLRAETAAVVAGALLMALREGLVHQSVPTT